MPCRDAAVPFFLYKPVFTLIRFIILAFYLNADVMMPACIFPGIFIAMSFVLFNKTRTTDLR